MVSVVGGGGRFLTFWRIIFSSFFDGREGVLTSDLELLSHRVLFNLKEMDLHKKFVFLKI